MDPVEELRAQLGDLAVQYPFETAMRALSATMVDILKAGVPTADDAKRAAAGAFDHITAMIDFKRTVENAWDEDPE